MIGTVGLLELGYRSGEVADLRLAYQTMLAQGAQIEAQEEEMSRKANATEDVIVKETVLT